MSQRSTELARQFEQAVAEFAKTVQECSDAQWAAVCSAEGWTVAQTAQHVSGQFPLEMEFVSAGAEGKPLPALTWDELNSKNERRAGKNGAASKTDVLKELQTNAASTAAYIRALTDEQLDRTGQLALADGASVSTQQLIEGGVLIAHVTGHLESIRGARVPSGSRTIVGATKQCRQGGADRPPCLHRPSICGARFSMISVPAARRCPYSPRYHDASSVRESAHETLTLARSPKGATKMSDAIKIAEQLADEFRPRAAEYDRSGEFPAANYARMKEAGYLRAPVPAELGGLGAGLLEMSRAQQALARGCASTALAVNMHLFQVGTTADGWRNKAPVEPLLKRIVEEGIVISSNGAESIVAGEWTTATTAEKRNGEYVVNGRKFFCSQAPGMDMLRFLARDTETNELLIIGTSAKAAGLKVVETWDTTGMRATASHDIVIEDLHVPETAIGARLPAGAPTRTPVLANVGRWFLSLVSGVYLGVAEEARADAYRAIGTGINSANRDDALTNVMVGQMEAEFLTARSIRDQAVGELDTPPSDPQYGLALSILCKETVTTHAIAVVEKAVEIAGGRSYFRKSPLERLARDVRAARFHPPSSPVSFQMAGERARERMAAVSSAGGL